MPHSVSTGRDPTWTYMVPNAPRPSTPASPRRDSAEILVRTRKLYEDLSAIKHSLEARLLFHNLGEKDGLYCLNCTHKFTKGACGPSCPLLRPKSRPWNLSSDIGNAKRAKLLRQDVGTYRSIISDIKARGTAVHVSTVWHWERAVSALTGRCEVPTEHYARHGWPQVRRKKDSSTDEVFKEGWSFEEAQAQGPGIELQIMPEVRSTGMKRKAEFRETGVLRKKMKLI